MPNKRWKASDPEFRKALLFYNSFRDEPNTTERGLKYLAWAAKIDGLPAMEHVDLDTFKYTGPSELEQLLLLSTQSPNAEYSTMLYKAIMESVDVSWQFKFRYWLRNKIWYRFRLISAGYLHAAGYKATPKRY